MAHIDEQSEKIRAHVGRGKCTACDRNEADYQLRRMSVMRDELMYNLQKLGYE